MGNKIQGEGDYEAGRRFQREEQEFVKRKFADKSGKQRVPSKDEMNGDDGIHASEESNDELEDYEDTQIADNNLVFQNGQLPENGVTRKRSDDRSQPQRR